jgi:hypothetical protein
VTVQGSSNTDGRDLDWRRFATLTANHLARWGLGSELGSPRRSLGVALRGCRTVAPPDGQACRPCESQNQPPLGESALAGSPEYRIAIGTHPSLTDNRPVPVDSGGPNYVPIPATARTNRRIRGCHVNQSIAEQSVRLEMPRTFLEPHWCCSEG